MSDIERSNQGHKVPMVWGMPAPPISNFQNSIASSPLEQADVLLLDSGASYFNLGRKVFTSLSPIYSSSVLWFPYDSSLCVKCTQ